MFTQKLMQQVGWFTVVRLGNWALLKLWERATGGIVVDDFVREGETASLSLRFSPVGIRSTEGSELVPLANQQVQRPATGAAELKSARSDGKALVLFGPHRCLV